jgi:hypothetical protein
MLFTSVALAALLAGCEAKIGARKLSYQKIYKFTPKTQVTDHVSFGDLAAHPSNILQFDSFFTLRPSSIRLLSIWISKRLRLW